jgi:hypothetical protein
VHFKLKYTEIFFYYKLYMSVCLIILFETAINTYEYVYSKSLNMCLFKFSDFQRQKEKKNGEPIEIMFFFYHTLMLHAYSLPPSPGSPVSPPLKLTTTI